MLQSLLKKRKSLKASHALTILFLVFIVYVGLAALPEFLFNTGSTFYWKNSLRHYIQTVDEQYEGMLTTEKDNALLQNKGTYINLNGLMAKLMGQPMMNERVTLKNGHLTSLVTSAPDSAQIQSTADNIARFYQKQTENGGHFLFVMVSSQIGKYEDLLPTGYTDTTNETADQLLALLDEAGVPYLDLRESMLEDGLTTADSYFTTDHHWLPQTGFWAYTKILDKLEELGAIGPVDPFYTDVKNFQFQTYEDSFLGSSGKRTGVYYADVDDSIFIVPEFDTDISITIEERNLSLRGRFEDICYNTDVNPDYTDPDFLNDNMYGLYGWGDTQVTQWRNETAPETGRFMLIGESFGNIPFSLMSLYLSSCDEVDTRHYSGDFTAYYENYAPDTVVMEVNVDQAIAEITNYPYFPE